MQVFAKPVNQQAEFVADLRDTVLIPGLPKFDAKLPDPVFNFRRFPVTDCLLKMVSYHDCRLQNPGGVTDVRSAQT